MIKRVLLIAALAVMAVLGSVAVGPPVPAEAVIACDVLYVSTTVHNKAPNPIYRVNGSGPGLPTAGISVATDVTMTISWVVYGPGTWDNLYLEWKSDRAQNTWVASTFALAAACSTFGCDVNVAIPGTAVVGSITDNAAVFGMADPGTMTDTVLTVGKTFWMDGLDLTGVYRRVLISCTWAWVEASKTGPNYDTVWNGTPLPNHIVD